jgi:YHS domain-containing protein
LKYFSSPAEWNGEKKERRMKMRKWVGLAVVVAFMGGFTMTGVGEEASKAQTTCPVMKGGINKEKFVDYNGKRIYVCCDQCIDEVKKDPAKYVKMLEDEGVVLEKAQ